MRKAFAHFVDCMLLFIQWGALYCFVFHGWQWFIVDELETAPLQPKEVIAILLVYRLLRGYRPPNPDERIGDAIERNFYKSIFCWALFGYLYAAWKWL